MLKKEKVIILNVRKYGESDLIVRALNRQGASIGFMAKGGAKSQKRFGGGVLEPSHYVEVSYKERPNITGEVLHTLQEAQLIQGFDSLRKDYDRLQLALYFLSVAAKLAQEGTIDSKDMFDLLGNALNAAESTPSPEKLKLHFEIKVLSLQGVLPPIEAASQWTNLPVQSHATPQMERAALRQLEWDIHHSLEAYLRGGI